MAIYSLARLTTATANAAAAWELRTASTDRVKVLEIGVFLATAVASTFSIGRPAAIGVTPTSPVTVLAEDPAAPAGTATTALAWGTGPTVPTQFLRTVAFPATVGTGVIWTFPQGLWISVSSSLVLWNNSGGTNGTAQIYAVVDE